MRADKSVYLLGTPQLWEQFSRAGVRLICDRDGKTTAERADIVVTSFDTTLTYEKLTVACDFIRGGAEYLCTHPDFNCPTETGFIPDSGAIAACVTASTGVSPIYFGKPYPETVAMMEELTGLSRADMCIFGDRLYTDIATRQTARYALRSRADRGNPKRRCGICRRCGQAGSPVPVPRGGQRGDLRGMNGKNSFPTDHRRHRLRQIPDRAQSFLQGRGRGTHLDQQGAFCVLLIEACRAQIDVPA